MPFQPQPCAADDAVVVPEPCCSPAIASTGLCLADGTPIAVLAVGACGDCGAAAAAPTVSGWINLLTGVYTAGNPPAGAAACDTPCASPTEPLAAVSGLCLADGTPIAVTVVRDCDGAVTSEGWLNVVTGVFTPGPPPAGAGGCAAMCASPTEPVATTGLCLADGTPIAVTTVRDCDGVVTAEGWINLLTGAFTSGPPPVGTVACGSSQSVQVSGTFCDLDANGDVVGLVLIEYTYGPDGSIESVRLVDAVTGATYVPQGTISVCPGDVQQPEQDLAVLCDVAGDGTSTPFIRDYRRDENGVIVGVSNYTLAGAPYVPAGTVGGCEPAGCVHCETTELCDSAPQGTATLEFRVNAVPWQPYFPLVAGNVGLDILGAQALWDGQAITLPPDVAQVDIATSRTAAAAAAVDCPPCVDESVSVTVRASIDYERLGPDPACSGSGNLRLFNGTTVVGIAQAPVDAPVGASGTLAVAAVVPLADVLAGLVAVGVQFETAQNNASCGTREGGWELSAFSLTTDPFTANSGPGCGIAFLRTVCRDCDGAVVSTTDTTLDGDPYVPIAPVARCVPPAPCNSATESCVQCETFTLCDTAPAPLPVSVTATPWACRYVTPPDFAAGQCDPPTPCRINNPDDGQAFFDGGAVVFPNRPADPDCGNTGTHLGIAGVIATAAAECPECYADTDLFTVTVTGQSTNNGPGAGIFTDGRVNFFLDDGTLPDGTIPQLVPQATDSNRGAGSTWNWSLSAPVSLADLQAGRLVVTLDHETKANGAFKQWTAQSFTVTAVPVEPRAGCGAQFRRTVCRDCTGAVVSVTDYELDGVTPYTPVGAVGECAACTVDLAVDAPLRVFDECRCDDTNGDGIGDVAYVELIAIENDGSVRIVGTYTEDLQAPYTPVSPAPCPGAAEETTQAPLVLGTVCYDDGAGGTRSAAVVRCAGCTEATVTYVDVETGAVVEAPVIVPCAAAAAECRDSTTLLVCDVATAATPVVPTMLDGDVAELGLGPGFVARPGPYAPLWSGGTLTFPADPDGSAGDGIQVYRAALASIVAQQAGCSGTGTVTASVRVTLNGPGAGSGHDGSLRLYRGTTLIAFDNVLNSAPVAHVETLTVSAPVTAAELAAGDIRLVLWLETFHGQPKAWTADQFSIDVELDDCATQFLRTVVADCESGQVVATVDTTLDGQPYAPAGDVGQCAPATAAGSACSRQLVERCGCDDTTGDGVGDVTYVELWAVDPCGGAAPTLLGTYRDGDFTQPYTPIAPVDCAASETLDVEPVVMYDPAAAPGFCTPFVRLFRLDGGGLVAGFSDIDLDGNPYAPAGPPVAQCTPADAAVSTGVQRLTAGQSVNYAANHPGLQSITVTVLAGGATVTMNTGVGVALPAGVALTWSVVDTDDTSLAAAVVAAANPGGDVLVNWTYKATAAG
ncbi:hypothetical protein [Nonomuraea rubra]|uniref:hypothetical protein n=1 Tax=Nonomuraea rubra TaxID=46180 RepID=UPI0033F014E0